MKDSILIIVIFLLCIGFYAYMIQNYTSYKKKMSYAYLEYVQEKIPESYWQKLYEKYMKNEEKRNSNLFSGDEVERKYKKLYESHHLTAKSLKQKLNGYVTKEEIDHFVRKGYYPYNTYVLDSIAKQGKEKGKGKDGVERKYQKKIPNRYYYMKYMKNQEATMSPPPKSYVLYTTKKEGMDSTTDTTTVEATDESPTDATTVDESTTDTASSSATGAFGFITSMLGTFLHMFFNIFIGCLLLYGAKISQTNLMPTEENCTPFVYESKVKLDETVVNMDVVKKKFFGGDINFWMGEIEPEDVLSTKVRFPVEKNLDIIEEGFGLYRNLVNDPKCSGFTYYLMSIFKTNTLFTCNAMNSINQFFNNYCSESVTVILGPYIYTTILTFLFIINYFYSFFLMFWHIGKIFEKKDIIKITKMVEGEKTDVDISVWKSDANPFMIPFKDMMAKICDYKEKHSWSFWPIVIIFGWLFLILFIIVFFIGFFLLLNVILLMFFFLMPVMNIYILFKVVFAVPFSLIGEIVTEGYESPKDSSVADTEPVVAEPINEPGQKGGDSKRYTFSKMFQNFLIYKKNMWMIILSLRMIQLASSTMGANAGVSAILACIFMYWFFPAVYQKYIPGIDRHATLGLQLYNQAKKRCETVSLEGLIKKEPVPVQGKVINVNNKPSASPSAPVIGEVIEQEVVNTPDVKDGSRDLTKGVADAENKLGEIANTAENVTKQAVNVQGAVQNTIEVAKGAVTDAQGAVTDAQGAVENTKDAVNDATKQATEEVKPATEEVKTESKGGKPSKKGGRRI